MKRIKEGAYGLSIDLAGFKLPAIAGAGGEAPPSSRLPEKTDVLIIGAGLCGLLTAYRLLEKEAPPSR